MAFERMSVYLEKADRLGLIVADRPGGGPKEERSFLEDALPTIQTGTRWVSAKQVPLNVLTTRSHLVRHLQLADLVVGVTPAMVAGATKYAEPLFPLIKSLLMKNSDGHVGGTGLKLFPDELINLYHWVIGESGYSKVGEGLVLTLPSSQWHAYVDDDGMPSKPIAALKGIF
jgi:hypothetical protein